MNEHVFDYIIVGAGSAGCALAYRLSESGRHRVLVLEAGGDDRPFHDLSRAAANLMIHVPAGVAKVLEDRGVNWMYETEPETRDGRVHPYPCGRVLGGTSSINGMIYARGQHADYDGWRELGCVGWGWEDVAPFFKRSEAQRSGGNELRGGEGPLSVEDVPDLLPVSYAVIEAAVEAGIPRTDDLNGPRQEGVAPLQITTRNGWRCSSAVAYLHPAMKRPNVKVLTKAQVLRIVFDGRRAVGVEFERGGNHEVARANAEIILCAGSVHSPRLLELSGIGAGQLLAEHGIPVLYDNPRVGENLQDHFNISMPFRMKPGAASFNTYQKGLPFLREAAKFAIARKGAFAGTVGQVVAYTMTRPELEEPDIKVLFLPMTMELKKVGDRQMIVLGDQPGLTVAPCQLRPESRGSVHIKSPDPKAPPSLRTNYLSNPIDEKVCVAEVRLALNIAAQPALAMFIDHRLFDLTDQAPDSEVLAFSRSIGHPGYHAAGTCAMGPPGAGVVDASLRVHGVERLRVADCSIMPRLISGNTNAPAIMIGERLSDLVLNPANTP